MITECNCGECRDIINRAISKIDDVVGETEYPDGWEIPVPLTRPEAIHLSRYIEVMEMVGSRRRLREEK